MSFQRELNRLAGTTGKEAQHVANVLAGTEGKELLHALNVLAGTDGKEYNFVVKLIDENAGGGGTQDANIAFDDIDTLSGIDFLEMEIFGYLFNKYVEKEVLYS
jgi:hypothetical protein